MRPRGDHPCFGTPLWGVVAVEKGHGYATDLIRIWPLWIVRTTTLRRTERDYFLSARMALAQFSAQQHLAAEYAQIPEYMKRRRES